MAWSYEQPVKITYGPGSLEKLPELIRTLNGSRGLLVIGGHLKRDGTAARLLELTGIQKVFSGISENPRLQEVDACAQLLRKEKIDYVVAVGGGSVIDCAKIAALLAANDGGIKPYFYGEKQFSRKGLPLIAVPTTAGTGSEVTSVSVLTDDEAGKKQPVGSPWLYPTYAMVDPKLTETMPPRVTAQTGIDALCHALEGFWSIHHQPVCDALALYACRLVFRWLPVAYADGENREAREKMAEASMIAGLTFALPKTTGSHACSFPLTNQYHIPHGEACGLTLDWFARLNADCEGGRLQEFARDLGFPDVSALADAIHNLKVQTGLRCDLKDLGLSEEQVAKLVKNSHHPNLLNNPIPVTDDLLSEMYHSFL